MSFLENIFQWKFRRAANSLLLLIVPVFRQDLNILHRNLFFKDLLYFSLCFRSFAGAQTGSHLSRKQGQICFGGTTIAVIILFLVLL